MGKSRTHPCRYIIPCFLDLGLATLTGLAVATEVFGDRKEECTDSWPWPWGLLALVISIGVVALCSLCCTMFGQLYNRPVLEVVLQFFLLVGYVCSGLFLLFARQSRTCWSEEIGLWVLVGAILFGILRTACWGLLTLHRMLEDIVEEEQGSKAAHWRQASFHVPEARTPKRKSPVRISEPLGERRSPSLPPPPPSSSPLLGDEDPEEDAREMDAEEPAELEHAIEIEPDRNASGQELERVVVE